MSLTPEQKALRRTGVGASEVAAILGLSPFATPLDIWRQKVEGLGVEETPHMRLGTLLEPVTVALYVERVGGCGVQQCETLTHLRHSWALATPDRHCVPVRHGDHPGPWLLECKAVSWRKASEWGDEGTDAVPQHYLLQCLWQLEVTGLSRCDVAALFGGEELRVYTVNADVELQAWMLGRVGEWWERYVVTRTPPPVDGSESTARWLAERFQQKRPALLEATPYANEVASIYMEARKKREEAEGIEEEMANVLRQLIG